MFSKLLFTYKKAVVSNFLFNYICCRFFDRICNLRIKILPLFLLCTIIFQLFTGVVYFNEITKHHEDNPSISSFKLSDELLTSSFKQNRKVAERKTEIKFVYKDGALDFKKGNSLFYYYNQELPKTLSLSKINASFFSIYFSTYI